VIVDVDDASLAQRVTSGDREAEAELCRRMGPRIRLYGLRHLRSSDGADDLVQLVLLKTLKSLRAGRLRAGEKLSPFVLGTCRMTVLDMRRGARRQEQLLEQFGHILVPDRPGSPRLDSKRLAHCVQRLSERERSIVIMTFYDDHTAAELAKFLSISEGNVRVIRHRAIRQLRGCMEGES
jgi:RNA polymerase sigma-70 factor (ECF subfamily)